MALTGHGTLNSKKDIFQFDYLIKKIKKRVSKNNSKKFKKRHPSKIDILDFKLDCAKMFLMKFC